MAAVVLALLLVRDNLGLRLAALAALQAAMIAIAQRAYDAVLAVVRCAHCQRAVAGGRR